MPRRSVIRSCVGGILALGLLADAAVGSAAAEAIPRIAVLPIKLLDTSAEPDDQTAAHRSRLTTMAADITTDLAAKGRYDAVSLHTTNVDRHCSPETSECLLALARAKGADLAFVGVVHKSSTLILQMWARIVDTRSGRTILSRELNFRGDNDESWRRAEAFLIDQIEFAPPKTQP